MQLNLYISICIPIKIQVKFSDLSCAFIWETYLCSQTWQKINARSMHTHMRGNFSSRFVFVVLLSTTVEHRLTDISLSGRHLRYNGQFWMSGTYFYSLQYIKSPWRADTPLLHMMDIFFGPTWASAIENNFTQQKLATPTT